MSIIDNRDQIAKLDKHNMLSSVESLPEQIEHAWKETTKLDYTHLENKVKNIVVAGMGGSNLGGHVIKSVFSDRLQVPLEIVAGYQLPAYVDESTLVILSSYSGTTEEVLSCTKAAHDRNALILAIAAGGEVEKHAVEHKHPFYKINPKYNPSNQPRMAIGYAIFGMIGLLSHAGLLELAKKDIDAIVESLRERAKSLAPESETNMAKTLAYACVDRVIYLIGAEHLSGAVHVFNNQINENAKQLTNELHIPDLNHHYLEALSFPKHISSQAVFFFFQSKLFHPQNQKRVEITREIVEDIGFPAHTLSFLSSNKLQEAFELIQLGAYTNFYLAMLNGLDPAPIPNVESFKQKLK